MRYKVWIEVEAIDEDADHYERCGEPIDVGVLNTEEEALCFQAELETLAWTIPINEELTQ